MEEKLFTQEALPEFIQGADLSTLTEVESLGGRFYDNDLQPEDPLDILQRHGINLVRLRLWNDPYSPLGEPYGAGTCDLTQVTTMARRLREKNIPWLLTFHYSDFWADPGKQRLPKAWQLLQEEELPAAVYTYTKETLETLAQEGTLPVMVAVGNELSNGLLWPYGKVPHYGAIARLVSAGIQAVRAAAPQAKVMIHLDNGGNNGLYRTWFDEYLGHDGADFEYIGLSYYPFWHGALEDLKKNMENIALRYGKNLLVTETSTAFSLEDYGNYEKLFPENRKGMATRKELTEKVPYPMTPEGQKAFLQDLIQVIRKTPQDLGKGFVYWEPCWIPVPGSGWANEAALAYIQEKGPGGNEWANQTLFDYAGRALPALKALKS